MKFPITSLFPSLFSFFLIELMEVLVPRKPAYCIPNIRCSCCLHVRPKQARGVLDPPRGCSHPSRGYHALHDLEDGRTSSLHFISHPDLHCNSNTSSSPPAICPCNQSQDEIRSTSFQWYKTIRLDL